MIKKEFLLTRADDVNLYRIYSDNGKYIVQEQTGNIYSEAVDVEDAPFTYIESDEDLPQQAKEG